VKIKCDQELIANQQKLLDELKLLQGQGQEVIAILEDQKYKQ